VSANGISFGGTRSLQWWVDWDAPAGEAKFQIASVHAQNTNQRTAELINRILANGNGWKLHSQYMHGEFFIFVFVRD
jgi:hypothetical protein